MDFAVLSRDEARDFHTDKKHIVISVMCPGDSEGPAKIPENKKNIGRLTMAFHDWDKRQKKIIEESTSPEAKDFVLFDRKMATQIVEFVRNFIVWDLELIVCQCDAGISRSAGIAAALAKCINGDNEYYFKHFLPNSLVYSLIVKEWQVRRNR